MIHLPIHINWKARLSFGAVAVGAAALWWLGGELPMATQAFLWIGLLAVFAILSVQFQLRLFGPVLFYDLVRTARRSRYILLRFLYALVLFAVLCWMAANLAGQAHWTNSQDNAQHRAARLADTYFATFMTVQVIAVLILTPAYSAGAIAEEKDRKTLEFVLATTLEDREIVLGKLTSRLVSLALLLLVSLPILSLMQFLGGVDPGMLLACFLATGLTMTSLASVSILASVFARRTRAHRPRLHGLLAYLFLRAAGGVPEVCDSFRGRVRWFNDSPPTLLSLLEHVNHGHIFMAYMRVAENVVRGGRLSDALTDVLGDYIAFHLVVIGICTTWAVVRLRSVALQQAGGAVGVTAKTLVPRRLRRRPPVSNRPMLWKEVYAEPGGHFNMAGRILLALMVIASFVPAGWILFDFFGRLSRLSNWSQLHESINVWARIAGPVVACLLWLSVAVRASGSIGGERDRDTLDSLLTSPLTCEAMYFAKWWGSICSVRWGLLWLAALWTTAVFLGGLSIRVPVLAQHG